MNLSLCPGVERKTDLSFELLPISCALRHNCYFQSLKLSDTAPKDLMLCIASVLRHNKTLRTLHLTDVDVSSFFQLTGTMIKENTLHSLLHVILSGVHISTEGIVALAEALEVFQHSLLTLDVSRTRLTGKQASILLGSLGRNYGMSLGLQTLDLSHNKLETEGSKALETWLWNAKDYSNMRQLHVSHCGLDLTAVCRSLRGFRHMEVLDLSHNKLDRGANQLLCVALEDSDSLRHLDVSHTGISPDQLPTLVLVLVSNHKLRDVHLIASHHTYLKLHRKHQLQIGRAS